MSIKTISLADENQSHKLIKNTTQHSTLKKQLKRAKYEKSFLKRDANRYIRKQVR